VTTWKPGQSGNPSGKPRGARHRATVAAEQLLAGEAKALTRKAIELALQGDTTALRLCLDRVAPVRKGTVRIALPEVNTPADLVAALGAIGEAVARGELTPDEGQSVAAILEGQRRAIETTELETRLARLEAKSDES
jgi:hypothetical protein